MKFRDVLVVAALGVLLAGCGSDSSTTGESSRAQESAVGSGSNSGSRAAVDIDTRVANADSSRGRTLFLQCRACHSLGAGEPHKVGPNLNGMFGRGPGLAAGFPYSEALENADLVWDNATLDTWIERPSEMVPGNKMVFIGIRDAQDRADLIAYLQAETGATP